MTNSRAKGARGEREWAKVLTRMGFPARRGQQFAGGPDSPDVVCESLKHILFECKVGSRQYINFGATLDKAFEQARADCGTKRPVVVWRNARGPWVMSWEDDGIECHVVGEYMIGKVLAKWKEQP